ncbi:ABC transporter permease [Pseudomonas sp. v388]|uniref:ABC transporter permease n=1 Tax=Pseudomonas sp. v388 TaxID=2479849 RepID=UPI000F76A631|nr:ABC transporter permease [Pseudomonas sp. v388]RRV10465.1 ABC transporter permease [Pseudomonas sp. v388]
MIQLTRLALSFARNVTKAVPTIFAVIVLSFFLLKLAPGDAADFAAAESGAATVESIAEIRHSFGVDKPVYEQLANYFKQLFHFDLGFSQRYGLSVSDLILDRLPGTLVLMGVAIAGALILGISLGTVMAVFANRLPDRIASMASQFFYSVPAFWVGMMLVVLFSVKLGWFPSGGARTIGGPSEGFAWLIDRAKYVALPALSLMLYYLGIYARLTRGAMLEAQSLDYVRVATAKGLTRAQVIRRHVLRNALIPITTVAGMHVAGILGGAVVVETVFNWPGMGRLAYEAVMAREPQILMGVMLVCALMVIVTNAVIDLVHTLLDPRVKVR